LARRIGEHFRLAGMFTDWVDEHPSFERMAPVPLTTVCFRAHPVGVDDDAKLNDLNDKLMNAVNASGQMFITQTKLHGSTILRLVVSHLRTEDKHVAKAWRLLQEKCRDVCST
jgi:aromatic-L-amino-acid decarboxylase